MNLAVLGSTGSIGTQALEVCRALMAQGIDINVAGLSAGSNEKLLKEQFAEFKAVKAALGTDGSGDCIAGMIEADVVLNAIGGLAGIRASFAAVRAGKTLLLANKETVVACGDLLNREAAKHGAKIVPVDSEHSAVFQCLGGSLNAESAEKIILTASGGAFRGYDKEGLESVDAAMALNHPTWKMGRKVTIDSATLMNKGFEVIEAARLFNKPFEDIEVVVHPQSVIHSMVKFNDGAVIAQLAPPDMRLPIQYALTRAIDGGRAAADYGSVDFLKQGALTFEPPDFESFPCLGLAIEAGQKGLGYGAVLVGADEAAVELFLTGKIGFNDIPKLIESALCAYNDKDRQGLETRLKTVRWGYDFVKTKGLI